MTLPFNQMPLRMLSTILPTGNVSLCKSNSQIPRNLGIPLFLVLTPALPFLPFGASLCMWWVFDLIRFGPLLQQGACKHQSLSCPECLQAPRKPLCTRTPAGSGWCWLPLALRLPSNSCTFGLRGFSPRSFPIFRQGAARAPLARGSWSQPCAPLGRVENRQGVKPSSFPSSCTWLWAPAEETWKMEWAEGITSRACMCQSSPCFSRASAVCISEAKPHAFWGDPSCMNLVRRVVTSGLPRRG